MEAQIISRHFLYLLLVNLPLLANLKEWSTCKELGCFLEVGDNILDGVYLVDEATEMYLLYSGRP